MQIIFRLKNWLSFIYRVFSFESIFGVNICTIYGNGNLMKLTRTMIYDSLKKNVLVYTKFSRDEKSNLIFYLCLFFNLKIEFVSNFFQLLLNKVGFLQK